MPGLELIEATKLEDIELARELIQSGSDVNQQDEQGWTSLNFAAGRGNLKMVELLVENGADVFKVGRDRRTSFMIALAANRTDVCRYLREVEDKAPGEKPKRPERQYCKAYHLGDLKEFPGWSESRINWRQVKSSHASGQADEAFTDQTIVFLHQDFTVTESMWPDENVIFNQVTQEWKEFCVNKLKFIVPDDLSLAVRGSEE